MSRTDKTRPAWVRLADSPMHTCVPHHDHRFGPCTLPDEVSAKSLRATHGCRWRLSEQFAPYRLDRGGQEWNRYRRQDRLRSRHQARRLLRRIVVGELRAEVRL
ncbi:hypothetical protein LWF15_24815 [Kineosporia rhizophila]|uniref:hypothetical protein n=1 Tax=Kineosporia TaxID=49184 RepID=UPI000B106228|nr:MULTISPECIES: hypothetical protein [Kineosporia]MCE0538725.1 hypothetical protein [Kineosporia rhizophila]GLY19502.1 hypothetical protein Kisp01_65160 [Kineosporia sp. NBRC 101677]